MPSEHEPDSAPPPKRPVGRPRKPKPDPGHKAPIERVAQEPKPVEAAQEEPAQDNLFDYYDPDLDLEVSGSYGVWEELQELFGVKSAPQVLVKARVLVERLAELQSLVDTSDLESPIVRDSEAQRQTLCLWLERGAPFHMAAALAYVPVERAMEWKADPRFDPEFTRARGRRQLRLQSLMSKARAGEWQKFATFLERQFSEDWSVRKQQDVNVSVNYVNRAEAIETLRFALQCVVEEAPQIVANRIIQRVLQAKQTTDSGKLLSIAASSGEPEVEADFVVEGGTDAEV